MIISQKLLNQKQRHQCKHQHLGNSNSNRNLRLGRILFTTEVVLHVVPRRTDQTPRQVRDVTEGASVNVFRAFLADSGVVEVVPSGAPGALGLVGDVADHAVGPDGGDVAGTFVVVLAQEVVVDAPRADSVVAVVLAVLDQSLGPETLSLVVVGKVTGVAFGANDSGRQLDSLTAVADSRRYADSMVLGILLEDLVPAAGGTVFGVGVSETAAVDGGLALEVTRQGEVSVALFTAVSRRVAVTLMDIIRRHTRVVGEVEPGFTFIANVLLHVLFAVGDSGGVHVAHVILQEVSLHAGLALVLVIVVGFAVLDHTHFFAEVVVRVHEDHSRRVVAVNTQVFIRVEGFAVHGSVLEAVAVLEEVVG